MMLEYWPVMLVAGSGLVAWGDLRARLAGVRRDVDTKASKEVVDRVEARLAHIDEKLDRLLERE